MIHVYPENDLKEHELEGTMCPCNPKVDWSESEGIVIHNSWDFREVTEDWLVRENGYSEIYKRQGN
jgi:hypothetical protein